MVGLLGDVVERQVDGWPRPVGLGAQVVNRGSDDRERRPQLVARVRGELPLAPERVADRDESPPRVEPAQRERGGHDQQAPDDQDGHEGRDRPDLVRDVRDHLDGEPRPSALDDLGVDPDRDAGHLLGAEIGAGLARRVDRVGVREAGGQVAEAVGRPVGLDHDRDSPRFGAAEGWADREVRERDGRPRGHEVRDLVGAVGQLLLAAPAEGVGGHDGERHAQHQQQDQRRAAAPQQEAKADPAQGRRIRLSATHRSRLAAPLERPGQVGHRSLSR